MADEALTKFLDEVASDHLKVEDNLGEGFVRLRISEAQRRQAKQDIRSVEDAVIELLRNSKDAGAKNILLATWKESDIRHISVIDDGIGIPEHLRETVFEPRVTSKLDTFHSDSWGVHGRGMALYSIRENARQADITASIYESNTQAKTSTHNHEAADEQLHDISQTDVSHFKTGTALHVAFSTTEVAERKDQSTLPLLNYSKEDGWLIGSGPHNIVRIAAEFALENRHVCTLYVGSPVEIAATAHAFGFHALHAHAKAQGIQTKPAHEYGIHEVAPLYRLAWAQDAATFSYIAQDVGLSLSSRSAYRIFNRTIAPLSPLLERLPRDASAQTKELFPEKDAHTQSEHVKQDLRGLVFTKDDKEAFLQEISAAYAQLASQYYLSADVDLRMRIVGDELRISIPVVKE